MADLETFRAETRSWLEANCPKDMRVPVRDDDDVYWGGRNATFKNDAQKAWFENCRDKGYTVPAWPKEYGGAGLGKTPRIANAGGCAGGVILRAANADVSTHNASVTFWG